MRIKHLLCITLIVSSIPMTTYAELMVGGYSTSGLDAHPISQFSATAQGTAAPIRQISGAATQLIGPGNISYEPIEGLLYVSDFWGQAIRVFPAFASGNIAPLSGINPPILGQPRANVPLPSQDELMVIGSNCCIFTFPLHASGDAVAWIRSIDWGGLNGSVTELNNPSFLTWIPGSDEVAVVDYDSSSPYAAKVVFHARTAQGNATPTRVLKSVHTAHAVGLAHNPVQHKLYVMTYTTSDDINFQAQIRVFADNASGTDAPLYSIEGASTQLAYSGQYPYGIGLDLPLHRLMVSFGANGDPSTNRVLSFALDASGDAVPVQVLTGTSLSSGTVGTPFAVPVDPLFASGFEN